MTDNNQTPPHTDSGQVALRLGIAGIVAGLLEGLIVSWRVPDAVPGAIVASAASAAGILTAGATILLGGLILALASRILGHTRLLELLDAPASGLRRWWTGTPPSEVVPSLVAAWGGLVWLSITGSGLLGGSILVLARFHEPLRMAALIAAIGIPVTIGGRLLGGWLGRFLGQWLDSAPHRVLPVGRATAILCLLLPTAGGAVLVIRAEELFGALDPAWALVCLLSGLVLLAGGPVARRLHRLGHRLRWSALAGFLCVAAGLALATSSPPGRGVLIGHGALAGAVYGLSSAGLDWDGDGFAWLIGGDCHPFDKAAHPFARELPGNGYDENCDGSDEVSLAEAGVDPIDALPPATGLARPGGNVVVIILDAHSAKHMSLYGAKRKTTPKLDAFAEQATVFDNFFAVANHTALAMPALLTGQYPSTFPNVTDLDWNSFRLEDRWQPIQQRVQAQGHKAMMFAGHRLGGFLRGFDKTVKAGKKRTSAAVLSGQALAALRTIGPRPQEPVVLFVHYIDAHHPYRAASKPNRFGRRQADRYDAELAYVDERAAAIYELMRSKEYRDWLVIVTSDHGEGFYEHGTRYHGKNLYAEEIRVPLVLRVPGVAGGRTKVAAGHLDLVPTILDWIGSPADPALPGRSLLPLLAGAPEAKSLRRFVFAEFFRNGHHYGAFDGHHSLLYHASEHRYELFDDRADPAQKSDLFGTVRAPDLEAALRGHVAASFRRLTSGGKGAEVELPLPTTP